MNKEKKENKENNENNENKENKENSDKDFSKHSLLTITKKAGIKSVSQCSIEKINELLNEKIKYLSERLCIFYKMKQGKTINKKILKEYLDSEGINIIP
jgi:histone H3/H4